MSCDLKHLRSGNIWKITHRWFFRAIMLACIYVMVSLLPKPGWVCDTDLSSDYSISTMTSSLFETFDDNSFGRRKTAASKHDFIDPSVSRILRLFPIYSQQRSPVDIESGSTGISQNISSKMSFVKIFRLQNCNFSHFGRTWLNEIAEHDLCTQHLHGSKNQVHSQFRLKTLKQHQKLPDCVRLKVPRGAMPTKICVHYPQDDNFISNRLRDTGLWEMDLVFQMEEFFRNNPQSQLVDLGCNIGVFTLSAAAMAKPVLAVDVLPSNLALIQLSIAINDESLEQININGEDIDELLHSFSYSKKTRPKYSELITTVHNAMYSRHTKMYVYLKDDPNLGGTEVKELNIQQESTRNIHPKNISDSKMHAGKGNESGRITYLRDSQSPDSATGNPQIVVDAICLDDLVPYIQASLSIFLKIDIEGSEPDVFLCANNFFMHADVRVILMEILFHRYSDQAKKMADFLMHHNMVPSEDVAGRKLLDTDLNNMYKWPENMFWIRVR